MVKRITALTLPVVVVGLAAAASQAGRNVPPPPRNTQSPATLAREPIAAPMTWVPFSADLRLTSPTDRGGSVGKFYRDSNGSIRVSSGPTESDIRVITIHNIPKVRSFVYSDGAWESAPMQIGSDGRPPKTRLTNSPGLELYPFKLAIFEGQDGSLFAKEGLVVYRSISGDALVRLEAPSLNWFAVVSQSITGRRHEYSNIKFGDQPASLFEPGPGEPVNEISEYRGIVQRPKDAPHPEHPDKRH